MKDVWNAVKIVTPKFLQAIGGLFAFCSAVVLLEHHPALSCLIFLSISYTVCIALVRGYIVSEREYLENKNIPKRPVKAIRP